MNERQRVVAAYTDAARGVVDIVSRINDDLWSGPGLGEWNLRSLVGHTSRAMVTVLTYLDRPAQSEDVVSPEAYFALLSTRTGRARCAGVTASDTKSRQATTHDTFGLFVGAHRGSGRARVAGTRCH